MKLNLMPKIMLFSVLFMLNSCSSDSAEDADLSTKVDSGLVANYTYNAIELETLNLINNYRSSVGLNRLEKINHISYKSEEHDFYMIDNNVLNHYNFAARSKNIIKVLGAKSVGENIAYNFNSPKDALNAWLNSPDHKINLVGDYTHFGIAIKENPATGEKYYTNIFAKL